MVDQIQEWNQNGTLTSLPKLWQWLQSEHRRNISEQQMQHYISKVGFQWVEVKKRGEVFNSPHVQEWPKRGVVKERESRLSTSSTRPLSTRTMLPTGHGCTRKTESALVPHMARASALSYSTVGAARDGLQALHSCGLSRRARPLLVTTTTTWTMPNSSNGAFPHQS